MTGIESAIAIGYKYFSKHKFESYIWKFGNSTKSAAAT
jgi:hypothetical protein